MEPAIPPKFCKTDIVDSRQNRPKGLFSKILELKEFWVSKKKVPSSTNRGTIISIRSNSIFYLGEIIKLNTTGTLFSGFGNCN